jgi:hypothetical protein
LTIVQAIPKAIAIAIAIAIKRSSKARGQVLPGLIKRREAEIDLFFEESKAVISTQQPIAEDAIDIRQGENPP